VLVASFRGNKRQQTEVCCHRRRWLSTHAVEAMASDSQSPFRWRFCFDRDCGGLFFICSHCDRGQRYCSEKCRKASRRRQVRSANQRYQQSIEARLDHRDHQRAYRLRKAHSESATTAARVTDHGSQSDLACATMPRPRLSETTPAWIRLPGSISSGGWLPFLVVNGESLAQVLSRRGMVICRFCGRVSRFINPFYESV